MLDRTRASERWPRLARVHAPSVDIAGFVGFRSSKLVNEVLPPQALFKVD